MFSYLQFKAAYEKAKENNQDVFKFKGRSFVLKFAYYLLEYIQIKCDTKHIAYDEEIFSFENNTEEIFMPGQSLN